MAEKKKLLIYAHYYVPDTASTGQILRELAEGLLPQFDVTVICVVPSYLGEIPEGYRKKKYYREEIGGVHVLRVRVPPFSKSSKKSRVKNILSYFFGAMRATFRVGKQDYVYTISQPPILGGLLGVFGKWVKRARLIYNIQDFNPEQIMAVGYSKNRMILRLMMWLDRFSCRRADKVIVVGRDMVQTLKKRFPKKMPRYAFINNWIDERAIVPLPAEDPQVAAFRAEYGLTDRFVFMYSGNIGLYYDLERLFDVLERFPAGTRAADGREVAFAFVGAGSLLERLQQIKAERGLDQVIFIPYQDKDALSVSLNAADVHFCINAAGIKGVSVPSKCYGIMAVGKPILGVLEPGSEARTLIEEADCGRCCDPGDYGAVTTLISDFLQNAGSERCAEMGARGRAYLTAHLTRDLSVTRYAQEILDCGKPKK